MISLDAVQRLVCEHSGLDQTMLGQAELRRLNQVALPVFLAGIHQHPTRDQRPDLLEQDLEEVRKKLRDIIRQIEALDAWALAVARRAKVRREIDAAGTDVNAIMAAMERAERVPPEEWPDKAAIRHLRDLENGLKDPIGTLFEKARGLPDGRGTKPNLVARNVALCAARALSELTGKPVSYWRDGTAFAKLTASLFLAFNIKADTRRACEWALSELTKSP